MPNVRAQAWIDSVDADTPAEIQEVARHIEELIEAALRQAGYAAPQAEVQVTDATGTQMYPATPAQA